MNCDTIADVYCLMEHAVFGRTLQRRRCEFLDVIGDARTALIIGDGDGRFLAELHKRYPKLEVDSIDVSARMLSLAQRRVASPRISFFKVDARYVRFPRDEYDVIVTHFFLDCLSEADTQALITRVSAVAVKDARWIVSEFRMPARGWPAFHAALWLSTMYFFFRLTTGLSTRRLPRYHDSMASHGFILEREVTERFGLVASEFWTCHGKWPSHKNQPSCLESTF
ncbi:MAG TPA: class I SAM-dependent methyltransferase [Bryobacteraceae bacterium]|jgi:ubiquinone/menaquinone biosynthesis C-methylase UbiE|nr:class I SAM-dependent methyltransferase [Bryobacteraceae bacterium]